MVRRNRFARVHGRGTVRVAIPVQRAVHVSEHDIQLTLELRPGLEPDHAIGHGLEANEQLRSVVALLLDHIDAHQHVAGRGQILTDLGQAHGLVFRSGPACEQGRAIVHDLVAGLVAVRTRDGTLRIRCGLEVPVVESLGLSAGALVQLEASILELRDPLLVDTDVKQYDLVLHCFLLAKRAHASAGGNWVISTLDLTTCVGILSARM